MAYQLSWIVPDRVIWYRLYEDTTLDEIAECHAQYLDMLESGEHVHTLFDLSLLVKFPTTVPELVRIMEYPSRDLQGWVLLVANEKPLLKFVASTTAQIVLKNARLRMLETITLAIHFLRDQDQTLDREKLDGFLAAQRAITS